MGVWRTWLSTGFVGLIGCGPSATAPLAPPPDPAPDPPPMAAPAPVPAASSSAAVASPPTPIAGDLPDASATTLVLRASCTRADCPSGDLRLTEAPDDAQSPAHVWTQTIEGGATLALPRHPAVTLYGVVLDGEVRLETANATDGIARHAVPRWHAFAAPEAQVRLVGVGDTTLVLAVATSEGPIHRALTGPTPPADRPHARSRRIEVVDVAAREDLSWAGGSAHARIVFEEGRASLQILTTSADSVLPPHRHPDSWEVIGLLRASGTFAHGEARDRVDPGLVLAIPPGIEHGFTPDGASPVVGVQLYVPPGPEQRFKQLAGR